MLTGLFPADVLTAVADPRQPSPPLLAAEEPCVARAVPKRRAEFAAGRACARGLLARLGVRDFPLLSDAERAPVWPEGVVGSITHTEGLCAAVVARDERYLGLGIDAEPSLPLDANLVAYVCRPEESLSIAGLSALDPARVARLIFSAKEAVYKCQFPMTRRFIEFQEVRVSLRASGEFSVEVLADVPELAGGARLSGRFAERSGFLLTASWLLR